MPKPLTLKNLDATFAFASDTSGTNSPHILLALNQLQEIWSGAYDADDTIKVLRHEARRLDLLAHTIEQNLV